VERHNFGHLTLSPFTPVVFMGRCLTLPGQHTWRLLIGSQWSGRTLLFSDVGVFGVQNKLLGWMAKIACMWPTNTLEVEYYEWGCVSRKWFCFVAFYCWSMTREVAFWHLLSKESLRVSHSRESRDEKYELKLLNFYPKKPHKWRRFSIYTSSVMIFTPHERLLGQDICQTGGVLMLMIVYTAQLTVRRFGQLPMAFCLLALFLHT